MIGKALNACLKIGRKRKLKKIKTTPPTHTTPRLKHTHTHTQNLKMLSTKEEEEEKKEKGKKDGSNLAFIASPD